jgi:hypothetical protein
VASLADSPALDELPDALSPEGREVTLELVVPRHDTNGTARSWRVQPALTRASVNPGI